MQLPTVRVHTQVLGHQHREQPMDQGSKLGWLRVLTSFGASHAPFTLDNNSIHSDALMPGPHCLVHPTRAKWGTTEYPNWGTDQRRSPDQARNNTTPHRVAIPPFPP